MTLKNSHPIGVFDSGYGGLTVLKEFVKQLPHYDYIYLGDNARAPYGNRSFEVVYEYTWECVQQLFKMNCRLVILACNTASAKALRTIQQNNLPHIKELHKVLGVIRPTSEIVGNISHTKHIGIFATAGTVASQTYPIEIQKFFPGVKVFQQACPMWVPIVENNEIETEAADFFIKKYCDALVNQSSKIDTVVLGCTHYPLLVEHIKKYLPQHIKIISQDAIVARSLADYLNRHPEIDVLCSKNGTQKFYSTDSSDTFDKQATLFFGKQINSELHDI